MLYRSFAALLLRYEPRMSTKKRVRESEKDPVDQKQQTSTLAKLHTKRFAWQRGDTLAKPDSFAHDRFFIFFYIFCCCAQFTYCRNSDDSHFLYRTIGWIFNHFTTVFTTCIRGCVCVLILPRCGPQLFCSFRGQASRDWKRGMKNTSAGEEWPYICYAGRRDEYGSQGEEKTQRKAEMETEQ